MVNAPRDKGAMMARLCIRGWRFFWCFIRVFLCDLVGHIDWIYSGAGGFCPRCARDIRESKGAAPVTRPSTFTLDEIDRGRE